MALQTELTSAPAEQPSSKEAASLQRLLQRNRGPAASDRMFFTEQLALLLETGENLHGALNVIAAQTGNPAMQRIVEQLAEDISEGKSFAVALASHGEVFSTTYVNLIAASESGGFMHEVLQQLLEMELKREELRKTLVSAGTYPMFLIAFSFAVVVFVLVVVFPKFESLFASIYDQLPASTRGLMAMSLVLREYWYLLLSGVALAALLLRQWMASDSGRRRIDHWKLNLPVVRDVFAQVYLTQSLQVLGLSLRNGVSVVDSLAACRDVVRNVHFSRLISAIEENVQSGAGVAAGFSAASFVPDLAKHMISTGERSGHLGQVMTRIAKHYSEQLASRLDRLSKLAEPVMLLVMGTLVGVLVSSLILPIFKLSRAVG